MMSDTNNNNGNDANDSGMSFTDAWFSSARSGNCEDIAQLVKLKSVPLDTPDHLGNTALHYAATAGHADVIEILIKVGANVNCQNKVGDTPLHKAAGRARLPCIKVLVNLGKANVDIRNRDGERPTDLAKDPQIKAELEPIVEGFDDDDDDEDDEKYDKDYDSDEEPEE
ncbi:hypothetical protein SAMD00019534_123020, partial [Acytostelium subglobosum LB1]|uniref:hypothetical protein n=1 Tax=Acytostelium subglobosum LB1 TaxID=1410327 RepID=UPI000644FB24